MDSDLMLQFVPVLHAAGDRSMTLFCGWTKKFSFGVAVLACGHNAIAQSPFKPASYGAIVAKEQASQSAPSPSGPYSMAAYGGEVYGAPAGYETYPGQYSEPSTYGEYVQGCDAGGGGCSCGGAGCGACGGGILGHQFGAGIGAGLGAGDEGACCPYCGVPGCTLAGRCVGSGRSAAILANSCLSKVCGFIHGLTPYGEGGVATPRWFDASVEMIALRRDSGANFNLTSAGAGGPIVLNTNMVDQDSLEPGLMLQLNHQIGVGSNIELVYFGLNKWDETATVTGPNNLFSYLSDFGTSPFGGFVSADNAFLQTVNLQSVFHNGEFNIRRRWTEPSGYFQGSFLAGIRYFDLDEEMNFASTGFRNQNPLDDRLFLNNNVQTRNQLVGFQLGTDFWWNLMPGVKIGTEIKSGIYGNNSEQASWMETSSTTLQGIHTVDFILNETADDGRAAYLTSFNTQLWYRLSYSWAFKTSFQLIYVDNVALVSENINPVLPSLVNARREAVRINNDGEVLYTGFTLGAEYSW